ncbi:putative sulfate exporter family transporter [Hydrogenophaga sp. 2FB]|uniref:YeiH family protein n=1 Tax=Hydrogenophaga sp. 2FB TaxID=2502187 RepID=UPI0010F74CC0|nr:putative sulfate exporter family transporter [Hydrogenophaga sp. 2FB]
MTTFSLGLPWARAQALFPGVVACAVIASAAAFLAGHYHAPMMLFALLLGVSMNFLSTETTCAAGVSFMGRTVLRWGVALLGLRITFADISALGWQPVAGVVVSVALTILISIGVARMLGFRSTFGLLSGGATAICGASAALALAAAMPPHPQREKALSFTVIGVSVLSTLAMVLYPIIARWLGLDPQQAGVFLGGTIHDVAQVVGAGYSMSKETGDTATVVKLMRVAMLLPVITLTVMLMRARTGTVEGGTKPPLLPWFAVVFAVLVVINSLGWIPKEVATAGASLSGWFLVASIAAIGVKTQIRELMSVGVKPVALMFFETVLMAVIVLGLMRFYG